MKRALIMAALLVPTTSFAQQVQQQVPPAVEAVQLAYRQLGLAIGQALDSDQSKIKELEKKIKDWEQYAKPLYNQGGD